MKDPRPLTDNEVNDMRNLKKKVDFMKEKLTVVGEKPTESEESSSSSDEEEQDEMKPAVQHQTKRKQQRAGVSAEVYGQWNQKSAFVPKVILKNEDTKNKLKKRLL